MKKFVEKMKRFWSLDAKTSGGFTLVELIVVIAILAILAGIAVPAYSGYVEKAKKAEDEQLLATVNTAFAAACIENGTDVHSVDNAAIELDTDKSVKAVTVPAAYDEAFQVFYAGNADKKFGVTEKILFDAELHMFVNPAEVGKVAMSYGNGVVYVNAEDLEKLGSSTFMTADGLGAEGLLNKVNEVTLFASEIDSDVYAEMFADADYLKSAAEAFGVDTTGMSDEEIAAAWEIEMQALSATKFAQLTNGLDLDSLSQEEIDDYWAQADSQVLANTAVLFAAQNATQQSEDDIFAILTGTDPKTTISQNMSEDYGAGLSQAALAYGMYTAYAYSTGDAGLIAKTENPIDILKGLTDEGFQDYLETDQAKTDLQGYLSALNMVNSSTENSDAVSNVLVNGFNDPELIALLQQSAGQK